MIQTGVSNLPLHGGEDEIPYPVNRELMDKNTELLREALKQSKLGDKDKLNAVKRLKEFIAC